MTEYAELLERLRKPFLNDETLRHWDSWRKYIAEGGKASWPRDAFESTIDAADEERADAAKTIATLLARTEKAKKPRVKPLEWTEFAGYFECREWDYRVTKAHNGMFGLSPIEWPAFDYPFASAEEAKAVAQADYEDRILSALEPSS